MATWTAKQYIENFYGNSIAQRSGVPLINHINEGVRILKAIGADEDTCDAFMLHPMFQNDHDLETNFEHLSDFNPRVIAFVMEYRNIANAALSDNVSIQVVYHDDLDKLGQQAYWCGKPLKLSPLKEVNMMLVADKVQNRADFDIYHKDTHARSKELDFYFQTWHNALGVTEDDYKRLIKIAKGE